MFLISRSPNRSAQIPWARISSLWLGQAGLKPRLNISLRVLADSLLTNALEIILPPKVPAHQRVGCAMRTDMIVRAMVRTAHPTAAYAFATKSDRSIFRQSASFFSTRTDGLAIPRSICETYVRSISASNARCSCETFNSVRIRRRFIPMAMSVFFEDVVMVHRVSSCRLTIHGI